MKFKSAAGSLVLVATAFIWGISFVAQTRGMEHVGPLTFNAARSVLACAALFLSALMLPQTGSRKAALPAGILCGLILSVATASQQIGLKYTSVGRAGFISSLYVVMVPVFELLFFRRKTSPRLAFCVLAALFGVWLLCSDDFARAGRGDLLIFASALLYALHILALSRYSPKVPALWLACVQFSVCAALNTAAAFAFESVTLPSLSAAFGSIAFAGLLSSALAYTLQIVALKHVKPTVTSLIFCLEAVFALLAGWIVLNERLSTREWIGCAVVFGAIVVSQLPSLKRKKAGHHNSI